MMNEKNTNEALKFSDIFLSYLTGREQEENPNKVDVPSKIIGNDSIKLCLYEDPKMSTSGGIAHFGFHVENFDQIMDKCKELNVEVLYGGPVEFEKSRSVYIKDPSGYDIELSEVSGGGL